MPNRKKNMLEEKISKHFQNDFSMSRALVWIFVAGTLLITVIISYSVYGGDMSMFLFKWCEYYKNHRFLETYDAIAAHHRPINYPPVFPAWLYLVHSPVNHLFASGENFSANFLIRMPELVFHAGILIYFAVKKEYRWLVFWALNPLWLLITGLYGQTDEWFCFLILVMIHNMNQKKFYQADVAFALMCLWKTQGAAFAVLYLFGLFFYEKSWQKRCWHMLIAGGIIYLAYLPFAIQHNDPFYIIRWYQRMSVSNDVSSYDGNLIAALGTSFASENISLFLRKYDWILVTGCICAAYLQLRKTRNYIIACFVFSLMYQQFTLRQLYRYGIYPAVILTYLIISEHCGNRKLIRYGKLFVIFIMAIQVCEFIPEFLEPIKPQIAFIFLIAACVFACIALSSIEKEENVCA